jgi:cytochrome c
MERFMASHKFANPIDMQFAPSGDLYLLEYGTRWFQGNEDARLVRIEYNAGNRTPVVAAAVDKPAGATPLRVVLSSAGTIDVDDDELRYEWTISRPNGTVVQTLTGPHPTFTVARPGAYTASLVVTDALGARDTAKVQIAAGNEPPRVEIDLRGSNRSFFFAGVPIRYVVRVNDREDGSLASGRIPASRVVVTAQHLKDGLTERGGDAPDPHEAGRRLVEAGTCLSCHQVDRKSVGPAFTAVAQKHKGDTAATAYLARKIRRGGSGVWGNVMMPPHSQLSEAEASRIAAYVLSLAEKQTPSLPVRGEYTPDVAPDSAGQAVVVLRASYADRGANGAPSASGEKTVVLRAPTMVVAGGDTADGVQKYKGPEVPVEVTIGSRSGAFVAFKQLDLTGVSAIVFSAVAPVPNLNSVGGKVEVRLDSASGALVGETEVIQPQTAMEAPRRLRAALRQTAAVHDVYFVFRNDQAEGGRNLFVLLTARFESAAPQ